MQHLLGQARFLPSATAAPRDRVPSEATTTPRLKVLERGHPEKRRALDSPRIQAMSFKGLLLGSLKRAVIDNLDCNGLLMGSIERGHII